MILATNIEIIESISRFIDFRILSGFFLNNWTLLFHCLSFIHIPLVLFFVAVHIAMAMFQNNA